MREAVQHVRPSPAREMPAGLDRVVQARQRQRRHRERLRSGRIPLALDVDARVIEALLVTGAITEPESLSRHAVETALGEMVDEWSRRALSVTP